MIHNAVIIGEHYKKNLDWARFQFFAWKIDDIDDEVHDVYLSFKNTSLFCHRTFRSYFRRRLFDRRNSAYADQIKQRRRFAPMSEDLIHHLPTPAEECQQADLKIILERALATLSAEEQRYLRSYYWSDLSFAELSRLDGSPEERLKTIVHRARLKLRKFFLAKFPNEYFCNPR